MEQTGIVLNTQGERATVRIVRGTACGDSCGNCNLCENKEKICTVINTAGAKAGEYVHIEIKSSVFFVMAFVAYIFPLILTGVVALFMSGSVNTGTADFITLGVLVVSIFLAAILGKLIFKGKRFQSRITEVIAYEKD